MSNGVGVERIFPLNLPSIQKIEINKNFFINTTKLNTRPILFYGQPTVSATEIVKGQIDSVQTAVAETDTITGTIELNVDVEIIESAKDTVESI